MHQNDYNTQKNNGMTQQLPLQLQNNFSFYKSKDEFTVKETEEWWIEHR